MSKQNRDYEMFFFFFFFLIATFSGTFFQEKPSFTQSDLSDNSGSLQTQEVRSPRVKGSSLHLPGPCLGVIRRCMRARDLLDQRVARLFFKRKACVKFQVLQPCLLSGNSNYVHYSCHRVLGIGCHHLALTSFLLGLMTLKQMTTIDHAMSWIYSTPDYATIKTKFS